MGGIKMRKFLNFKANIGELSNYVKCNPKGVYYIENSFFKSKSTRYFMYLRKQGLDMNQAFDHLLKEDKNHIDP